MRLKYLERKGKRGVIKLLASLSRTSRTDVSKLRSDVISKIAVVRQDNRIGNIIFTMPLIEALKEDYPEASIYLIAGKKFAGLLERMPELTEVIRFNQSRAAVNPFYYFSFRRRLKRFGFDLTIDAGSMTSLSTNNIMTAAATGAKYIVGYDRKESSSFLNIIVPQLPEIRHESQIFLHLADFISGGDRARFPRLKPTEAENDEAGKKFRALGISESDFVIGMHIGGRYDKRWDVDNFKRLANHFSEAGARVLVFSGPDERKLTDEIGAENDDNIIIIDSAPIGAVIGLTSRSDIFITGDTGPLHIAAALGIPCVQIFRVDNAGRYGYNQEPNVVVDPIDPSYGEVLETVIKHIDRIKNNKSGS